MPPVAIESLIRPDHSNGRVQLLILIAMTLGTVRLIEATPLQSANDRSRWATVWSLVERGTYQIDEVRQHRGWDTIDKVRHNDHFYSSKPPLFATLVAGGYWVLKHTLGWTINPADPESTGAVCHLLLFLVNIVPTAVALGCLAKLLWRHGEISFTRNFVFAAACFGTLWSAYLPSLNNHTPAICCVVFALRAAIVSLPAHLTTTRVATAGFMAGSAVTFELPALAFFAGLFVILLKTDRRKTLLAFLPAAIVPIAAFFVTNYIAAGDWKPFYAHYGTDKYLFVENGVPSYWLNPKGVDAARDSFYEYLLHCTFGHHGLFSLTPILVLSFVGMMRVHKWQHSPLAAYNVLGALMTAIVLVYFLTKTDNYNYGGVSVGLRWMLWLIPFWLLMMLSAVDLLSSNRLGQWLLMALMAPSIFSAWHPFDAPWRQPWLFDWMTAKGWIDYSDPPPKFDHPRFSWIGRLPMEPERQDDYWVEFSGVAVDGTAITLRIADGGPVEVQGRPGRRVEFVWNQGRPTESSRTVVLDAARVNDGDKGDLILWPEGKPSSTEELASRELVYGLPLTTEYRCAAVRYQRLPMRKDAFRCEIGVGFGARGSTAPGIESVLIRSEFWSSPELPFGVAYWDLQTSNYETGSALAQRKLSLVRAGRLIPLPDKPKSE
jgi:hypothetical protein